MSINVRTIPSRDYLLECVEYDKSTGMLTRKVRPRHHFSSDRQMKCANKNAGKQVNSIFTNKSGKSYYICTINRVNYYAHRIIFKILYNIEPEQIDHDDGNGLNNLRSNLIGSDQFENSKNHRKSVRNTSGVVGVGWNTKAGKWYSEITVNKKSMFLGAFDIFEDAVQQRKAAEIKHGFNIRHGEVRPL